MQETVNARLIMSDSFLPRILLMWIRLMRILLIRYSFSLVVRRPIPAITPPSPREGDAAGPYYNAVDCRQLAAAGRHLLRDQGVHGLDHRRARVVIGLPAPRFALPVRNTHRLVGVHDKNRYE